MPFTEDMDVVMYIDDKIVTKGPAKGKMGRFVADFHKTCYKAVDKSALIRDMKRILTW